MNHGSAWVMNNPLAALSEVLSLVTMSEMARVPMPAPSVVLPGCQMIERRSTRLASVAITFALSMPLPAMVVSLTSIVWQAPPMIGHGDAFPVICTLLM